MRRVLLCVIALWLSPCVSRADAISEPPSCPLLSEPIFCHGPPTCGPRECLSSGDCALGEHCAIANLCTEEHGCGGIGGGVFRTHVFGPCDAGETCFSGTCSGLFVCVPGASEDAAVGSDAALGGDAAGSDAGDGRMLLRYGCDCHCSVGAPTRREPASPFLIALFVPVASWLKRRRSARQKRSSN